MINLTSSDGVNADFYDSDGDGQADFAIAQGSLQRIEAIGYTYVTLNETGLFSLFVNMVTYSYPLSEVIESSAEAGWEDPARD